MSKALLMILDGWGIGNKSKADVISVTPTPHWDALLAKYPHSQLQASGENVGLPDGQMGNSEVGHLNIGAGRVVYQDLVKINRSIRDNSIMQNPEIVAAYKAAQGAGKKLHIMGLCSTGGVHSSLDHLFKLVEISKEYGVADKTFVHCFMDGRDTDPRSGKGFVADLQKVCDANGAHIASIIGRFYAMDRDKRWERIKVAYDQLVNGIGRKETDMVAAVQGCYDRHTEEHKNTDEFMEPLVNANCDGRIAKGDVVIFFNYRNDRAKEITIVLTQQDMPEQGMQTIPDLHYCCMTLPRFMNIPGENLNGVLSCNEYLTRVNLMDASNQSTDTPLLYGKNIAVIGGGNTAMDAVRTAKRLGAEHAIIVYRRSEEEMPARIEEVRHAKEEGIEFMTLHNPIEYHSDENGRVKEAVLQVMQLGEPDESGRRSPVPVEGKTVTIPVDLVIVAVGVSPNPLIPSSVAGLEISKKGTIVVNEQMQSAIPTLFAGGDIVRGGATVILAMSDGRKAAKAMHEHLQNA